MVGQNNSGAGFWQGVKAAGGLALIAALLLGLYQAFLSFRDGQAPHYDLHMIFGALSQPTGWAWLNKIIGWTVSAPLFWTLLAAGLFLTVIAGWAEDNAK